MTDRKPANQPLVGPQGSTPEDARLDALRAHRRAVADAPAAEPNPSLVRALAPLLIAQGADLLSTEVMARQPGWSEKNPLPGMQRSAGRIGWGALEAALLALAVKKGIPALGHTVAPAIHGTLAGQNMTSVNPSSAAGFADPDILSTFTRR